jgi:phosphodiesterase/alkaline phosphatase D-like protein
MTGLKPSTRYYYRVKSASGETSKTFTFKTQPDSTTIAADLPEVHLAFGDMGAHPRGQLHCMLPAMWPTVWPGIRKPPLTL